MKRSRILCTASALAFASALFGPAAFAIQRPEKVAEVCVLRLQHPHYSKGSPGVIAKATIICSGDIPSTVHYELYLASVPQGMVGPPSWDAVHRDNINVLDGTYTRYVPTEDKPGLPCKPNHYYYAYAVATLDGEPFTGSGGQTTPLRTTSQVGC
jgi:hypothetical protein